MEGEGGGEGSLPIPPEVLAVVSDETTSVEFPLKNRLDVSVWLRRHDTSSSILRRVPGSSLMYQKNVRVF